MDVAIATSSIVPSNYEDDLILVNELKNRGLNATAVFWDDETIDWTKIPLCVVRSVWDYIFQHEKFITWAKFVSNNCELWNSSKVIAWNTHKSYIQELVSKGFPCIPTIYLKSKCLETLQDEILKLEWEQIIIKPVVSLGAVNTFLIDSKEYLCDKEGIDQLFLTGDLLAQPFLPSVKTKGELSIIFINGHYSHSIQKVPDCNDFRVHESYGGYYEIVEPDNALINNAYKALKLSGFKTLYARVDFINNELGDPLLNELELVDPDLFLRFHPPAAAKLADTIKHLVS